MSISLKPILVLGATGYIGGRLVTELLNKGYRVRATGRSLAKLQTRPWARHPSIEIVEADILDLESSIQAAEGCLAGYYLIPIFNPLSSNFQIDYQAALNMSISAERAGLKQLIHLSNIWRSDDHLSPYLKSHQDIKGILHSGRTPVTSLHVSVVLGCGNAAFETLHHLVERFNIVPGLRWMKSPCQPIAVPDLMKYMLACLNHPETLNKSFEIGGPEELTFQRLMEIHAEEAGLPKKRFFSFPIFNSRLSAYWIHLVTPVPAGLVYQLVESLKRPAICQNSELQKLIPLKPLETRQAFRLFIDQTIANFVETHWTDAGEAQNIEWTKESILPEEANTLFKDYRQLTLQAPIDEVWKCLARIGGQTGWYYGNWLWQIRGFLDRLVGGVGLRRGRRHPQELRTGDALDVWRVQSVDSPNHLTLVAEMKLPGKAVLDFQLRAVDSLHVQLRQTAWFLAHGFRGLIYWFAVLPFHGFIFQGMIEGIAKATRLSYRFSIQSKLTLRTETGLEKGQFVNLSEGGCKVYSPRKISKSTKLWLEVDDSANLTTEVRLVDEYRVRDGYHLSLKFLNQPNSFRSWLQQAIWSLSG